MAGEFGAGAVAVGGGETLVASETSTAAAGEVAAANASRTLSLNTPTAQRAATSLRPPTLPRPAPRPQLTNGPPRPTNMRPGTVDRTPQLRAEEAFMRGYAHGNAQVQRGAWETIADGFVEAFHLLGSLF